MIASIAYPEYAPDLSPGCVKTPQSHFVQGNAGLLLSQA